MSKNDLVVDPSLQAQSIQDLIRDAAVLLEQDRQINVVTVEQITPYIDIFSPDQERMKTDREYKLKLRNLYHEYRTKLGINLYQPVNVIRSETDPTTVVVLDRQFTPVETADAAEQSSRSTALLEMGGTPGLTTENILMEAAVGDLLRANTAPDRLDQISRIQAESIIINRAFMESKQAATPVTNSTAATPADDSDDAPWESVEDE